MPISPEVQTGVLIMVLGTFVIWASAQVGRGVVWAWKRRRLPRRQAKVLEEPTAEDLDQVLATLQRLATEYTRVSIEHHDSDQREAATMLVHLFEQGGWQASESMLANAPSELVGWDGVELRGCDPKLLRRVRRVLEPLGEVRVEVEPVESSWGAEARERACGRVVIRLSTAAG